MFCILKALTAVLMAEKTARCQCSGWRLKTTTVEEINTVNLAAGDHLQKFTVNVPHIEGAPVGNIAFTDEITAATAAGGSPVWKIRDQRTTRGQLSQRRDVWGLRLPSSIPKYSPRWVWSS